METWTDSASPLQDIREGLPENLQDDDTQTLLLDMYREWRSALHQRTNRLQANILLQDRTFFVTQTGLVGVGDMGSPSVEVGDQVIMLDAAPFPMVIRSAAGRPSSCNQHELVGYAQI